MTPFLNVCGIPPCLALLLQTTRFKLKSCPILPLAPPRLLKILLASMSHLFEGRCWPTLVLTHLLYDCNCVSSRVVPRPPRKTNSLNFHFHVNLIARLNSPCHFTLICVSPDLQLSKLADFVFSASVLQTPRLSVPGLFVDPENLALSVLTFSPR
jgi:hypothetical protein